MKRLIVGILAHVDAGKTTLSEAMLYHTGGIRALGRVDHGDAFLDTHSLERERGITIFSKQAVLSWGEAELTLLDTPGHVDFSSEMERTLQVLDCAILVVSGTDGVQAHTRTLWHLLERRRIPTVLFINKMDLAGSDRDTLGAALRAQLDDGCVDFGQPPEALWEDVAVCDEVLLNRYLECGEVRDGEVADLVASRKLFPCWYGSALKLEGVDALLEGLVRYGPCPSYPQAFGAKVYKVAWDPQGSRLTYLKITGGSLAVKDLLTNSQPGLGEDQIWEEKADQIRIYSGAKYTCVDQVQAGAVCAVTGLSRTYPGEGLGGEPASEPPALEPVLTYQVILSEGCQPHVALQKLRRLEEEDPQLHMVWNERLQEIQIQLMGEIQMEVLKRLILERLGLAVEFGPGSIVYRETIAAPVEGVGHFEPLRHYAEVHLLLEPGERGSGLQFAAACPDDQMDRNWQRLVLTHLEERTHVGVLTGAPITDMKLTLVAGRAHPKHTEGGDFRQATYRAVRQGLMGAESVLLEPWYQFRLELPTDQVGRGLADLQRMCAQVDPPQTSQEVAALAGRAPVVCLRDYAAQVAAYTRGRGKLYCMLDGYAPCHNPEEVMEAAAYDPLRDTEHPADSVFCTHGAGTVVPWDQVRAHMHVDSGLRWDQEPPEQPAVQSGPPPARSSGYTGSLEEDKQLKAIFERTYGPVKRRDFQSQVHPRRVQEELPETRVIQPPTNGPEYLLVDGYNLIFAWEDLKAVAQDSLDAARQLLMDLLSNYQGSRQCEVILVFDAYRVPRGVGEVSRYYNIYVVYTKEAETADAYIEKTTYQLGRRYRVRVATSDGAEQLIILGHGALRLSARAFRAELEQVQGEIGAILARNNSAHRAKPLRDALRQAQEKTEDGGHNLE